MARQRENDACPGALQTHSAADGQLARIRLPGGLIDAAQLEAVALAAQDLGAPGLELTSRGNIQIRAVSDAAAVADPATTERVELDFNEGRALGVDSTPTFFLDGEKLDLQTLNDLEDAIAAAVSGGQ